MSKFTVKERDGDKPCFIAAEGFGVTVELNGPADMEHAAKVAKFLSEHVKDIVVESGTVEVSGGGQPTRRFGGKPISLLS